MAPARSASDVVENASPQAQIIRSPHIAHMKPAGVEASQPIPTKAGHMLATNKQQQQIKIIMRRFY